MDQQVNNPLSHYAIARQRTPFRIPVEYNGIQPLLCKAPWFTMPQRIRVGGLSWHKDGSLGRHMGSKSCWNVIEMHAGDRRKQCHVIVTPQVHRNRSAAFWRLVKVSRNRKKWENVDRDIVWVTTLFTLKYIEGSAQLAGRPSCFSLIYLSGLKKKEVRIPSKLLKLHSKERHQHIGRWILSCEQVD